MELPALDALRTAAPDTRITALANPPAHELLEEDPRIDRVVETSRWRVRHRWDEGDPELRSAIAGWAREQRFDLVLDANHAALAVARAIRSIGIRTLESDEAEENEAVARGEGGVDAIRASVRSGWGIDVPAAARPTLRPRAEHLAFADGLLHALDLPRGRRPFALSPVASSELKRWPAERFAAVADHVVGRGGGPILVLEGPQADSGAAVVEAMRFPEAAVRIGAQHLMATAALLQRCSGVLCNDTGVMHVAAAVGAPVVGAFGPTRAEVFLPPGAYAIGVGPRDVHCSYRQTRSLRPPDCWRQGRCLIAERGCIHETRLESVLSAVDRLLDAPVPQWIGWSPPAAAQRLDQEARNVSA